MGRIGYTASLLCGRRRTALAGAMALCLLQPGSAPAQRAVDVQIGRWEVSGSNPTFYSAGFGARFWGPLAYSLRGLALVDPDSAQRSLYGLAPELSFFRGAGRVAPYAVGGVGLAVRANGSTDVAALWYAGLGLEWNPLSWFGLALEASYLAEDDSVRGFWNLAPDDRRGWVGSARLAIRWGGGSRGSRGSATARAAGSASGPHEPEALAVWSPSAGAGDAGARLSDRIVGTAVDAMGEPYRWGGTSTEEGFDCSGLVWYAYTTHGIDIPRVSRDQARAGRPVPADIEALEAGDILLFANGGRRVTHVGLYIGDRRFIHATTSGGVRIGRLDGAGDANDRWWRERWVGARRILR